MNNNNFSLKLVVYKNSINDFNFGSLSSSELNLLMYLFILVRDKGTEEITISGSEIRSKANLTNPNTEKRLKRFIDKFCEKMDTEVGHYENEQFVHDRLFDTISYSVTDARLTVKLSESYEDLFNNISRNYTIFNLSEFCTLSSMYEKHLYRLLAQYRNSSRKRMDTIKNLRIYMGCPEAYGNAFFVKEIVKPAMNGLNDIFNNIQVEVKKDENKRGKPITETIFRWNKDKTESQKDVPEEITEGPDTSKSDSVDDNEYDDPIAFYESLQSQPCKEMSPAEKWRIIEEAEKEMEEIFGPINI